MKNHKMSRKKICERRQLIAIIYIKMSCLIGLPIAIIGSGVESDEFFNPYLYFIGLGLALSGLTLHSILQEILNGGNY